MSYEYDATEEERAAEALLREKGWSVSAPTCPLCHGWGHVGTWKQWGSGETTTSVLGQTPCPNGCEMPAMFFGAAV